MTDSIDRREIVDGNGPSAVRGDGVGATPDSGQQPKFGATMGVTQGPGNGGLDTPTSQDGSSEDEVFVFPMSFGQQRFWFLDQFEPGSPYYNIPMAIRLSGDLHAEVLARCLNEIVRRHEILRTTFTTLDGEPVQVISPSLTLELPVIDLHNLPAEEREYEAKRLALEEAREGFDLARGPLLRARLLRLDEREHVALLTMHHIISDGWSMGVLMQELAILYQAFTHGRLSPLPELPIQYADYAEWQRETLEGEVLESQLEYWKQRLGSEHPVLELPTDRPRPAVRTDRGSSYSITVPRTVLDALYELSRREGATLFMTLVAAFQVLLSRYSGQDTISVGTPIANRTRGETEGLIGLFINTLVLRTSLRGQDGRELSFRELLGRVKEIALGAYDHQHLPFEMLLDALQVERDMSHSPLFQAMFILQNLQQASMRKLEAPGLTMRMIEVDMGTSTFDITLSCAEQVDGLHTAVEYNTDLFDRSSIVRMMEHFQTLLEAIVADPGQSIERLPLLSPAELDRTVLELSGKARPYPLDQRLQDLFEAQVAADPDAVAVVAQLPSVDGRRPETVAWRSAAASSFADENSRLSYRQLNQRANQLAHLLQALGVQPGEPVAVCLERSTDMVVAVLAVLKAGGGYVPIDPAYPEERVMHMLRDSGAEVLLTQAAVQANLFPDPHKLPLHTVGLDTDLAEIARQPDHNPICKATPESLAYLIYTSGSTGQSKGVGISHRSIVNAALAWEEDYRLREDVSSHLQMAAFSFDVFTGDLARALTTGGKLVLCPREWLLAPEKLYALMRQEEVDCAEFVPAVLRHLVDYLDETGQDLSFMRLLICGSDSWYAGEYQRFQRVCGPRTRLINSFGLTEATVDSCYFGGSPLETSSIADLPQDRIVPIGKPFANQQLHVVDRHLQPAPIGVVGELYIGGAGVARGYHGRPGITAERFIPDPFGAGRTPRAVGGRLYRTGDMARVLRDGGSGGRSLEFLGRLDHQVKIRGFRIEPGEVEAALGQHANVRQAVVMARPSPVGDQRLVAYVVPHFEPAPTSADLRRFAQERLADYMVPAIFVQLDELPLTPNGKVDRQALPAPDWGKRDLAADAEDYVAPGTPVEEVLAGIFAQVLGLDRVGVHDDFFELGGHSLLATQLISRVRQAFELGPEDLPLRAAFESPSVGLLAEQVERATLGATGLRPPPIAMAPRPPAGEPAFMPLSFAQQRLWFLDQLEPNSPFYNIPESIRLRGPLDITALERALNQVVHRHESLRTRFLTTEDGRPLQVVEPASAGKIELPLLDLRHLPAQEREAEALRLATEEAQTPFDLARAPLLRARLLRLGPEDHVILVTTHHIISDNWSSGILVREMAVIYDALVHGRPSPLPSLSLQYADFAAWQRGWLESKISIDGQETTPLQQQVAYWKQRLAGLPPLLELPTDRPRPAVQTFRGDYRSFELSEKLSHGLRSLSQREGATLFMTLLAAFEVLLHRYSHQDDFAIGTPIANRTREEIEGIIGFFVNTLVLRADLSSQNGREPSFEELLQRVREEALGAYAHQDLPFEMLVEALQPERRLSHSPLFQVMFSLQSTPPRPQQVVSELTLAPVEAHSGTAKFDLTLFMVDAGPRLTGALEFNTDLFDAATIDRMLGHFQRLLEAVVAQPTLPVSRLSILTDSERGYLLHTWNDTSAEIPADLCAHELIEQQAQRIPHAIAASCAYRRPGQAFQEHALTYAALDARASQLAQHLHRLGAGRGDLAAICMPRSLELSVAILGVLKAGAAYVPVDPSYPAERIRFMLEDSGAQVVLTTSSTASALAATFAKPPPSVTAIVCLDTDWPEIARYPTGPASLQAPGPDHLAYVIYTSGSTGRPKGAMIHHRGLVNYLAWCQRAYPLDGGAGAPVHSSISFDLTVTSVLAPLAAGRQVRLLPEDDLNPASGIEPLLNALREQDDFSLVKITPAHLELLSHELTPAQAADRTRAFIIGGENLLVESIAFWRTHAPQTLLVNEYGPTEAVVGCCVYTTSGEVALPAEHRSGSVPIGRPIINTCLYALDRHMQPVPPGVPGELYIGGLGVARGYHRRPALTAGSFVPDPFHRTAGGRLYKTGDLVRMLPSDDLEFLGRIDHQVKVRGFRIELGEIDAVLAGHPAIKEAITLAREGASEGLRLVAYLIPADVNVVRNAGASSPESSSLTAAVRAHLRKHLPEHMVPSAFVWLKALPLTPNGKVDRRALPEPELTRADLESVYVAPRSPEEEILAGLWAELLGLEQASPLGVLDNFFELGGHSLLATQVISRVESAFGVKLALREVFEAPTIAGLAERIAVARRSTEGLPARIEKRHKEAAQEQGWPLSFAQQRLWFLDQLEPNTAFYNIPAAVRLAGPLDLEVLQRSLNEIVRRHEALRTTFPAVNGRPVQVIAPELHINLPLMDLAQREGSLEQGLAEVMRQAGEEARRPFDLATGPLLRAHVWRLADEDHVVLLNMHHIVSDDWSLGVLVQELAALYPALKAGVQEPVLPELPVQYADYATWQRQWLGERGDEASPLQQQIEYWKQQLQDLPPLLELPWDRPRPAMQTFNGDSVSLSLEDEVSAGLKKLARSEGSTLYMALQGAFQVLLYRYTGQQVFGVGTPIANRTRGEIEPLIGFFVNTLVMRADLGPMSIDGSSRDGSRGAGPRGSSSPLSFRELLRRVRETALQGYANQDVPFEILVDELAPERDMSHSPLFQAMFVLQNAPRPSQSLGEDLVLSPVVPEDKTARFDLTLTLMEAGGGLVGDFTFNTDLFDRTTIQRLADHFHRLVAAIIAAPDAAITDLPILSERELAQLAVWNDTWSDDVPLGVTVLDLFEQQVTVRPDQTAVRLAGGNGVAPASGNSAPQQLSYAELDRRAIQLASYLSAIGVGSEDVVAISLEKSPEMVIGLLGVLKAGAAYLPIDPDYPPDRIAYMLEDAGAQVLLTKAATAESTPAFASASVIVRLDADWITVATVGTPGPGQSAGSERDDATTIGPPTPDHLAYVIYTSGSTGRPKGTLLQHRGLTNLVHAQTRGFGVDHTSRVLQFASFSFDASISETFMALCTGAALVLPPREFTNYGAELLSLLREEGITTVTLPPSLLAVLEPEDLPDLRTLISAGEACTWDIVNRWTLPERPADGRAMGGRSVGNGNTRRVVNAYGPTEMTVGPTYAVVSDLTARPAAVPIGRPICNTKAYVLDRQLQPLPVGVTGELYLGGVGVARGYLRRPGLTAERFMPLPRIGGSQQSNGARAYRTGDLARWLPDGSLVYMGRADQQVKLRGFRIELGEVETVLRQHSQVQEAVVLVQSDRLVAYYVISAAAPEATPDEPGEHTEAGLSAGDLRRFLQTRVPEYMVPAAYLALEALPLTPSGKVDRQALRRLASEGLAAQAGLDIRAPYVAPRSPEEEIITGVWSELLGVSTVGSLDNFFELGGHSLLATQLVSRLRDVFGIDLPVRVVFASPTVAGLAAAVAEARVAALGTAQGREAARITPIPRDEDGGISLPLSFAQQRLWFLNQLDPNSSFYNLPGAVRLLGELDVEGLAWSIEEIVRRHESLRTTLIMTEDGEPRQVVAQAQDVTLRLIDLSDLPKETREAEARRLVAEEARRSFNLATGPLMRVGLLRLAAKEHVVLLNMHHIVSDGWSLGVFMRELGALYEAYEQENGELHGATVLPPLSLQYADYAAWQRSWLGDSADANSRLAKQLEFWKQELADLPPVLELPTDRPRPPVQTFNGSTTEFTLSSELSARLTDLFRAEGATLYMGLLAAFEVLLHRYSGQMVFGVGTPIAGRTQRDIEPLIGFFVNTLVMRADMGPDKNGRAPSFRRLLHRVRDTALAGYGHQDIPFEMLVDALQPERNMSHSPLFQVVFALAGAVAGGQNALASGVQELAGGPSFGKLDLRPLEGDTGIAKFDLTLSMSEGPVASGNQAGALAGSFEYNTDLFDAATIQRMIGHFQVLLAALAEDPDRPISELPLLTAAELEQEAAWNNTATDFPVPNWIPVHESFQRMAAAQPDATALVFTGATGYQRLTYGTLNRRANQVAHALRALGVGHDSLVAISMPRSPEQVIGLLGVLKTGGAYLPVDPEYPADRMAYMLADSGARVMLAAHANGREIAPATQAIDRLFLDEDWPAIAAYPDHDPNTGPLRGDSLAYAIYTSGSTGRPKGVLLRHQGLANLVSAQTEGFGISSHDRILQFASFSFDASVSEIFMALARGATLYLAPQETLTLPAALLELMQREGISVITLPPSLLQVLPAEYLPDLRLLISAGEACPVDIAARWGQGRSLFNAYGPTEATIGPTYFAVDELLAEDEQQVAAMAAGNSLPIGQPIGNMRAHVLDRYLQLTPVGVPGELYLAGVGLARGYLGRPALTAERFLPNPFTGSGAGVPAAGTRHLAPGQAPSDRLRSPSAMEDGILHYNARPAAPGDRLYRTGDLVRRLPDGGYSGHSLQFLGRADHQVKVRGFRVELGEVEAVLRRHDQVQDTVALVVEDRLLAYVIPIDHESSGSDRLEGTLREYARQQLPEHMVPSIVLLRDSLPQTPNGKVDRRALQKEAADVIRHGRKRQDLGETHVAPRDRVETALAKLWEEVLQVRPIGVTDSFFDLGGHSLLAVRLVARVEREFGVTLPLVTLFQEPTVEHVAATLRQQVAEGTTAYQCLVALKPSGTKPPLFMIHPSGGSVHWYMDLADHLDEDQPLYALQAHGLHNVPGSATEGAEIADLLSGAELDRTIEAMAARYVQEILKVHPEGPYRVASWSMGVVIAYEVAQQLRNLDRQVDFLGMLDQGPQVPDDEPVDNAEYLMTFFGRRLPISVDYLRTLDTEAQLAYVMAEAQRIQWLYPDITLDQFRHFVDVLKAHSQAWRAYRPKPYPGQITVFRATETDHPANLGPDLGWSGLAAKRVHVFEVPGDHNSFLHDPHVDVFARLLQACVEA